MAGNFLSTLWRLPENLKSNGRRVRAEPDSPEMAVLGGFARFLPTFEAFSGLETTIFGFYTIENMKYSETGKIDVTGLDSNR